MKLLIIDNDRVTVKMLTSWLSTYGYKVHHAYTCQQARHEWLEKKPNLVILDPILEDINALQLCIELRKKHYALLFILTDEKDIDDEVRCLQAGVDEYVRKPFYPAQFLARLQALSQRVPLIPRQKPSSNITLGLINMDFLRNQVGINGKTKALTPTESRILHYLAINANCVCSTSDIVNQVWGGQGYVLTKHGELLKPHIRNLRKKIEPNPDSPAYIITIVGKGYLLTTPVAHSPVAKSGTG
jgi:DNA-binding response OmpR family regulator